VQVELLQDLVQLALGLRLGNRSQYVGVVRQEALGCAERRTTGLLMLFHDILL
jgi:hypothetical protein